MAKDIIKRRKTERLICFAAFFAADIREWGICNGSLVWKVADFIALQAAFCYNGRYIERIVEKEG